MNEARALLAEATRFVRDHDLVGVPTEECKVVEMPEYRRGVSIAYCDSTGPLEKKQESVFTISPTPTDWPAARAESFYREYNRGMLHDLTVHEAMPGHFLQAMHANATKDDLRAVFSSGAFVEGWAVYSEWLMAKNGFGGPNVRLQRQKMALRVAANTVLDNGVHAGTMEEKEALAFMRDDAFQGRRRSGREVEPRAALRRPALHLLLRVRRHDDDARGGRAEARIRRAHVPRQAPLVRLARHPAREGARPVSFDRVSRLPPYALSGAVWAASLLLVPELTGAGSQVDALVAAAWLALLLAGSLASRPLRTGLGALGGGALVALWVIAPRIFPSTAALSLTAIAWGRALRAAAGPRARRRRRAAARARRDRRARLGRRR